MLVASFFGVDKSVCIFPTSSCILNQHYGHHHKSCIPTSICLCVIDTTHVCLLRFDLKNHVDLDSDGFFVRIKRLFLEVTPRSLTTRP